MGIDLLRKIRKIVDLPWTEFEDAINQLSPEEQRAIARLRKIVDLPWTDFKEAIDRLSPLEQRACMALVVHQMDQAKARAEDPTRQVTIVDEGREVLLARGLGSPGRETIRALWPLLTPDEQGLVARGSTLQASVVRGFTLQEHLKE